MTRNDAGRNRRGPSTGSQMRLAICRMSWTLSARRTIAPLSHTPCATLGELERGIAALDSARIHYEEATSILRALDTPLTLAHTIRHLGDIHTKAGRHSLAEQCCEEAVAMYRTQSNASALDVANAIRSLAVVKERLAQMAQARQLWQDAHNRYAALNIVEGTAEAAAHLGRLTRNQ